LVGAVCLLIQQDDIFNQLFLVADLTPVSLSEVIQLAVWHGQIRQLDCGPSNAAVSCFSAAANVRAVGALRWKSRSFRRSIASGRLYAGRQPLRSALGNDQRSLIPIGWRQKALSKGSCSETISLP
jgi:hypothetical protein